MPSLFVYTFVCLRLNTMLMRAEQRVATFVNQAWRWCCCQRGAACAPAYTRGLPGRRRRSHRPLPRQRQRRSGRYGTDRGTTGAGQRSRPSTTPRCSTSSSMGYVCFSAIPETPVDPLAVSCLILISSDASNLAKVSVFNFWALKVVGFVLRF